MKVIYWSDYACPFCYIGITNLRQAFKKLSTPEELTIIIKSFELDPSASRKVTSSTPERFALKYGMTKEEALRRVNAISEMGRSAGIDFRYAATRYTSTLDAHRLTKLAQDKYGNDIAEELSMILYDAYFTRNLELSDFGVLTDAGTRTGLNEADILSVLEGNAYEAEVRRDEQEAYSKDIHSVPFFVVNGRHYISGAQPVDAMIETLRRGLGGSVSEGAMSCGAGGH